MSFRETLKFHRFLLCLELLVRLEFRNSNLGFFVFMLLKLGFVQDFEFCVWNLASAFEVFLVDHPLAVELVNERHAGRDVKLKNLLFRHLVKKHHK